jgi:cobalt-zinc-cadmium efflux system membrane fusion protein
MLATHIGDRRGHTFELSEFQSLVITTVRNAPVRLRDLATVRVEVKPLPPKKAPKAELIRDSGGNHGLRLTEKEAEALGIQSGEAKRATKPLSLPPQIGTVNFDNDRVFVLRARYGGELVELRQVADNSDPAAKENRLRPLRPGDRVKQGEVLAVVWSKELGEKKAALFDAIRALRLSKELLERYQKLYEDGTIPLATLKAQEKKVQADSAAVLTAKRSLKLLKAADGEITEIEDEANKSDLKVAPKVDVKKWAEYRITAPRLSSDPNVEFTVVERNVGIHDVIDPASSPATFKLADLSRLQLWVSPSEDALSLLRGRLRREEKRTWRITFQADRPGTKALELPIARLDHAPDSTTILAVGYLPNKEGKYRVGQFMTATILIDPEPDTVIVPPSAVHEDEGETLVFVERDAKKREYLLRRVAVAGRFQEGVAVRSKLTGQDEELSKAEAARGRRLLQPLLPGERVLTSGVVELTAALETLLRRQ